jgi:CRISPR-associated protein Cas5t
MISKPLRRRRQRITEGDAVQTLYVEVPYASFRKSYARSFAETYPLPPPATIYGMLLSLVGERFRQRHAGVRLAFAYKCRKQNERCEEACLPHVATTLRKLSRFKYGTISTEAKRKTLKPDFIETLCGIEFLCWVDSSNEDASLIGAANDDSKEASAPTLEERIVAALESPASVERYGVLSLGLSDDAVNDVRLCTTIKGDWHRLFPRNTGMMELPVWVDHVGAAKTRWRRYELEQQAILSPSSPDGDEWQWTEIVAPN